MGLDRGRGDVEVLGDLLVGLAGVDQAEHLPFTSGQRRVAQQFGHVGAVDDVLDHRLVEGDADRPAEIALLLGQLDHPVGALGFHLAEAAFVLQRFEHDDDQLADAQEAADGAGVAGQGQGLVQVVEGQLAFFAQPVQLGLEDMVAIGVHHQAMLFGIGL